MIRQLIPRSSALLLTGLLSGLLAACTATAPEAPPTPGADPTGSAPAVADPAEASAPESRQVLEAAAGAPPPAVSRETLEAILERALHEHARHDDEKALDLVREALALGPDEEMRARLSSLRVEIRRSLVQATLIDAVALCDEPRVTVGEVATCRLVLQNISGGPLRMPAEAPAPGAPAEGTTLRSVFAVDVVYDEWSPTGTTFSQRFSLNETPGGDIDLAPGGSFELRIPVDTGRFNPRGVLYRTYTVRAVFRPAVLEIGGEAVPAVVTFRPATIHVFPRQWEPVARDPLGTLDRALDRGSAGHLPIAAALTEEPDRAAAIERLVTALRGGLDAAMQAAAEMALRILRGETSAGEAGR